MSKEVSRTADPLCRVGYYVLGEKQFLDGLLPESEARRGVEQARFVEENFTSPLTGRPLTKSEWFYEVVG